MKNTKISDGVKIFIGTDHNGFKLKEHILKHLLKKGYEVVDLGNKKLVPTDDYPDYAKKVSKKVLADKKSLGILLCGTGQGVCMVANKYKGIRASLAWSVGIAKKARHDDDANILCLPAWKITDEQAIRIVNGWLNTPFSKIPRHKRRVKKINA